MTETVLSGKLARTAATGLTVLALCAASGSARAQVVEYAHLDTVGNIRAVTDHSGAVIERHDYLPYGEEWNPQPGNQPLRFTGKERDTETGFDYFGARYYQAKWGRFTTTDPVYTWRENLVDPQRWNRYAYVRSNPLRYTDPNGKWIVPVIIAASTVWALLAAPDIANAPGPGDRTFKSDQSGQMIASAAKAAAVLRGAVAGWEYLNRDESATNLPPGTPPVYRGGDSFEMKPNEIKIDPETGLMKTTHGASVDASPEAVERFGGAYRVTSIPEELTIIQRGKRQEHYEIVPREPMKPERYQELLRKVTLE